MRPVIRLDMSKVQGTDADHVTHSLLRYLGRIYTERARRGVGVYPARPAEDGYASGPRLELDATGSAADALESLIQDLYDHYGRKPVVLIDEYDSPNTRLIEMDLGPRTRAGVLASLHDSTRYSSRGTFPPLRVHHGHQLFWQGQRVFGP